MRPPPGRQQLSREFIARHQRARIIAALAEETSSRGYRAVTVADIVSRAGIARNTFYENFSLEGGLLPGSPGLRDRGGAGAGSSRPPGGRELARSGSRRARRLPRLRRRGAGPGPHLHRRGALRRPGRGERYEQSLAGLRLRCSGLGRKVSPHGDGAAGDARGDDHRRHLLGHLPADHAGRRRSRSSELLPDLVEFALTPYIGAEAAERATRVRRRSGRD